MCVKCHQEDPEVGGSSLSLVLQPKLLIKKGGQRTKKVAQWVKVLATKPDDLEWTW